MLFRSEWRFRPPKQQHRQFQYRGREIGARVAPDRDIEIAGAVVLEGGNAIRCVVVTGRIGSKGKETVSGILLPVLFLKSALTP